MEKNVKYSIYKNASLFVFGGWRRMHHYDNMHKTWKRYCGTYKKYILQKTNTVILSIWKSRKSMYQEKQSTHEWWIRESFSYSYPDPLLISLAIIVEHTIIPFWQNIISIPNTGYKLLKSMPYPTCAIQWRRHDNGIASTISCDDICYT